MVYHYRWPRSGLSLEMAKMSGLSLKVANEWSIIRGSSHMAFVAPLPVHGIRGAV